jgi:oligopeptidase B
MRAALLLLLVAAADPVPAPPVARRQPKVTEMHGEKLVDDYAWLREKGTPEVTAHLTAERDYALAVMKPTAELQQKLYDEMLGRIQQTDVSVPWRDRGYWYYSRTEEGKQYPIYARRKGSMDAPEEVLLDLNALATGKPFISLGDFAVSPDGNLMAYTTDDTGYRQYRLFLKDLRTGALRAETAERVTSLEWTEDGKTLLYTVEDPVSKRSFQLYRHALGASAGELVYEEKDERFAEYVWKSRDRQYLFLQAASLTTSEVRYASAASAPDAWKVVVPRRQDHMYDVDHREGRFWIRTNDKGRNFRLVTAPVADPSPASWSEVVPHRDDVMLNGASLFRSFVVLVERAGGFPRLSVMNPDTRETRVVEMPEQAAHVGMAANAEYDVDRFRFSYQSPVTPSSTFEYAPTTGERKLLKQVNVPAYDASRYRVEVTQATAADGVKVPVWLLMKKEVKQDGRNPAYLYAYGSYGAQFSPTFGSNIFSLVDRGVVYAVAYPRGGGELGKRWHDEGRMLKKRNTFTDFVAAGDHLVKAGWTSPDRLAAGGGSAGGLLIGAVANLRPDLFKALVAWVPFVDVINTMSDPSLPLTVGEFEEWGNPKNADEYRYMRTYSPYENVAAKVYPALLVKTSVNDSQVPYWEAAKWVARLRATRTNDAPLLLHVNLDPAGHGGKSGRYDKLRETAFDYAFLLWQLGEGPRP